MRLRLPFVLLVLTAVPSAGASAQAPAPRPEAAPPKTERPAEAAPAEKEGRSPYPPMVFYLVRGEPDACGPGCSEWIAAYGTITPDAGRRLNEFLRSLGNRRPPVYFHSPGGSVAGGVAIGRLMRERRMTAGVARTIPEGCEPLKDREPACDAVRRSGGELRAQLRTARTLCNSSCVYALLGAATREVPAGARVGVHAMALGRIGADGMLQPPSKKLTPQEERQFSEAANARLGRYMVDMGIDKALLEAATQISHDRIRYLSRDEIARFRIDAREFQESRWMVDEGPPGPVTVLKYVVEAKGEEIKAYRTTRLRIGCRAGQLLVAYDRELAPTDRPSASIAVSTSSGAFVLPPSRRKPTVGYNAIEMETRVARVAPDLFANAGGGDSISILEAPSASGPARPPTRLSTAGLSSALATLRQNCR